VDRCALFVDAGYVLADGAMAVHGTRHRESVSWNYPGLLQFLSTVARDRSGLPLLRCYWYEATVEGRRSPEHEALADLPGVKLRLGRMRPGHREGVESEVHRDLITLARNGAVRDALVVSAEEDLAQVIAEVQDLGVRVTLAHIAVDGKWTISRALRQECDDIVELSGAHLRPYVDFVVGAEPVREDDRPASGYPGHALTNGHGAVSQLGPQALPAGSQPAAEIYTAPVIAEYQRSAQPMPNGQPSPLPSPHHSGSSGGPVPGPQLPPPEQQAVPGQVMAAQHSGPLSGQILPPGSAAVPGPASLAQPGPQPPASVPQPVTALPGQPAGQDAGMAAPAGPPPAGVPPSAAGFAPMGQPGGSPSGAMGQPGLVQPGQGGQPGPGGQPGMPQPGQPGYPAGYSGRGPDPAGPGGSGPAMPMTGQALPGGQQATAGVQTHPATAPTGRFTRGPQNRQAQQFPGTPADQPEHGTGYVPQPGSYGGPQPAPSAPLVPLPPAVSVADAVQAAHGEGFSFGQAVAREAPQLWLEAVLARKPRMPSDLEARLLQDSALPIDSLLHDEVRHALRRGFWDALERARH
jgi:NYN domain